MTMMAVPAKAVTAVRNVRRDECVIIVYPIVRLYNLAQ